MQNTLVGLSRSARFTRRQAILLFILASGVVPYFLGLGSSSLWDANESFYAEAARTMVETGDYVSPSFNGRPRFNKPVLPYWIIAGSYHVLGVSEKAERLPIAIGGLVMIATAFGLGMLLGSRDAGLLAAIVLATAPRFLMFARRVIIDVHLATFAGLTLLCFALAEHDPGRRRPYLVLMYIAMALGTLTKGPVAVLLPALVILLYLASERRLRDVRRMLLPLGAAIGAVTVLPWYVLVYHEHGWQYIQSFVLDENLKRYTETVGGHGRGPLFYLPVVLDFVLPWSLFVPFALWGAARYARLWGGTKVGQTGRVEPADSSEIRIRRTTRLLVFWVLVFVGFFSMSSTKQDLYILPILPAVAALIGAILAASIDGTVAAMRGPVRPIMLATGAVLLIGGAALLVGFVAPGAYPLAGVGTAAGAIAVGGLAATALAARNRLFEGVMAIGISLAVLSWTFVSVTLPDFERYKPVRPFAKSIDSKAGPRAVVGSYKLSIPSLVYYLRASDSRSA